MPTYKATIKEAIQKWNENNPDKPKKTFRSLAAELGVTASAISQMDCKNSFAQFQKHLLVIMRSDSKEIQKETFKLYSKLDVPIINRLSKIIAILECEIYDVVKEV